MGKFIEKIKDGVGLGIGLLLVLGITLGVYAFVEPSSSPSSDYVLNWNSPLNALHNNTNSRVSNIEESLGSVTANSGMYDNRIPANFNPPNDYTMICFKGGSILNDQMDGGDNTNDGVNCAVGDVGFIIEKDERASTIWSSARAICLQDEMRLVEAFEFQLACNNAGSFGLTAMTGNWEFSSNSAFLIYDGAYKLGVLVIGSSGCDYTAFSPVGRDTGGGDSRVYRCAK